MPIESSDPRVGVVRIAPGSTKIVDLREIPAGIKTLAQQGWAVVEIVSEKRAAPASSSGLAASIKGKKSSSKAKADPQSSE